jgi:hypothetical protein
MVAIGYLSGISNAGAAVLTDDSHLLSSFPEPSHPVCARLSVKLNLISTHAEEITVTVITIGKRLVPAAHVAFVEPFDPSSNPEFRPEKDFECFAHDPKETGSARR